MRQYVLLAVPLLVAGLLPAGAALTATPPSADDLLVGYGEGKRDDALLAVRLAGGESLRESRALRVLQVDASDASRLTDLLSSEPSIDYVETNDPISHKGTQWNGAEWNGAEWNGAEWNGAEWNGAEWNGAEWNAKNGAPAEENDPGRTLQWGLAAVNAPRAWNIAMGTRGADLCVLDSGVAWDHPDLAPNAWTGPDGSHGWNAIDGTTNAYDDGGHGTHVAGIAAAALANGWGVAGVGNVRIMAVKVLGSDGTGTEADLAFGLAWCADRDAEVALMALGADRSPTLSRAIAYAAARDVLLTASAGNAGPCTGCVGYPANDPRVLAVTALGKDLKPASFSSQGPEADLAAPGVDIISTFPGKRFVYGTGSSQAAAFAAGAAALLRDAHPGLDAAQTRGLLTAGARDIGAPGHDAATGHGLLDVEASMKRAG